MISIEQLSRIERINIIGTSGSGKTTLGRKLSTLLGLPLIEMDRLNWGPNWTPTAEETFLERAKLQTAPSQWVLDGNYMHTTSIKWRHAQLVVWLDMPYFRTILRVTRRSVQRSMNRAEIWPETGNRETLRRAFLSKDSVILWTIKSYQRNRKRYTELFVSQEYPDVTFLRLKSNHDVRDFLKLAHDVSRSK